MQIVTDKKAMAEHARKVRSQARLFEACGEPGLAADIFHKAGNLYHAGDKFDDAAACHERGDVNAFESMHRVLRIAARVDLETPPIDDLVELIVSVPE